MGFCKGPVAFATLIRVVVMAVMTGAAMGQDHAPAELPPPDFAARQYIDSRGCVFMRDADGGWQPRLHDGSELVCGYPPTLSARRLSPDAAARPFGEGVEEPARAAQVEQALAEHVFSNLQTGELAGQREPMQHRIDAGPEPDPDAPVVDLQGEIRAQVEVRRQMNDALKPNRSLCRLLGYDQATPGSGQLGSDPTQGFCDGLSPNDLSRLAFTRPIQLSTGAADGNEANKKEAADGGDGRQADVAREKRQEAPKEPTAETSPAGKAKPPSVVAKTRAKAPAASTSKTTRTGTNIPHIPANARFIRIGRFESGEDLDIVLRRLSVLGLPIVREKPTATIMVGPFNSRQAIVMAFDRLQRAGFKNLVPR